jgi:molecular chaperone GrpE
MMKKKSKEQEDFREENTNKTTENKEHNPEASSQEQHEHGDPFRGEASGSVSASAGEESAFADKVVDEVRIAGEKLAEMQDRYLRLSAEFDNYRKRTLREKMDLSKYATEDLFKKIIPIMDDFDRALAHMSNATACVAMKEGIDLIYNKFSEFLKQNGIKEIETLNENFNVDLHDAVAKVQVEDEQKKGKVVDIIQKGYYLQDKVLRHSKVVVGE